MTYSFSTYGTFGYNTHYNDSGSLDEFVIYVAFSHVYFRRQKFSFQTYMVGKTGAVENRRQKMESIYGAGFWSVCHGYQFDRL